MVILHRLGRIQLTFAAVVFFAVRPVLAADPAAELSSFSAFNKIDLAALAQEAKVVRGPATGNNRYLAVQSAYVVPRPPAEVAAKLRGFNPARYPDLKVYLHGESTSDFARLRSAPDNSAVQYLANATAQRTSDLQVSAQEMSQLAATKAEGGPGAILASAWPKILSSRAQAFVSGGSAAQPPYENGSTPIRPNDELNGLLNSQGKVKKQFAGLLGTTGIGRGSGSARPDMFWELLNADGKGVLTLGASYHRAAEGGSIQTASATFYASGGFYVGLTLHQLWPVQVNGEAATLVWRGDLISSAAVGGLRGIERMGAESTMMKDVGRAITRVRGELGR